MLIFCDHNYAGWVMYIEEVGVGEEVNAPSLLEPPQIAAHIQMQKTKLEFENNSHRKWEKTKQLKQFVQ